MGLSCFLCGVEVVEVPPRNCVRINSCLSISPSWRPQPKQGLKSVLTHATALPILLTGQKKNPHRGQCLPPFSAVTPGQPCCLMCVCVYGYRGRVENEHTGRNLKPVSGIIRESHMHANHLCMTHRIHGSARLFLQTWHGCGKLPFRVYHGSFEL